MRRRLGFTLIEILVVLAILGILVSISSLVWGSIASRGRDNTRKTDIARLKNTLEQYATDNRAYPTYDTSRGQGRVYAASWQLDGNSLICTHNASINERLTPNYVTEIPQDPRNKFTFTACDQKQDQHGLYLYITSPASSSGPLATSSANGYALLATLENEVDQTLDNQNPIRTSVGKFSYYYANGQLGDYNFDANYVVTGGTSR